MRLTYRLLTAGAAALALSACAEGPSGVTSPAGHRPAASWGPESPHFNLQAILRGDGFGMVKFRQANDAQLVIQLGTTVRGLEPNTSYVLQRAVDLVIDGVCTSTSWLTLGMGLTPHAIVTDEKGSGSAELFRSVAPTPVGSVFDIHFRIVNLATSAVVLSSDCYEYTISQ